MTQFTFCKPAILDQRFVKGELAPLDPHQATFLLTRGNLSKTERERIMRSLQIDEISLVDKPAQEGAKALIRKREDDPIKSAARDAEFSQWLEEDRKRRRARDMEDMKDFLAAQQEEIDALKAAMTDEEKAHLREEGRKEQRNPRKERTMFEQRVSEIQKRDSCSRQQAMRKARQEYPRAFEQYQDEGIENVAKVRAEAPVGNNYAKQASDSLMAKARDLMRREKIPLQDAMAEVRKANPDLLEKARDPFGSPYGR